MNPDFTHPASPWPHRWAIALACATFPLLWVGGLVTTTDSGMAVPDWPSTYGYNLFLYPWTTWLTGPWDLFVEHGHRLLGAMVGMMTIVLLALLWRRDDRRWMRWLGGAALALVIFQGVLGGMRVRFDERTLAMLHGCTGPLFFAVTVAMVVFTSRCWWLRESSAVPPSAGYIRRLALVTCILVYLQIVVGAVLRHVPVAAEPGAFVLAVRFHLFLAAAVTLHVALLAWFVLSHARTIKPLGGLAIILAGLVAVQLALGAGTWIVKFSVPAWVSDWISTGSVAVQDGGWLQTHIITAHVAAGSLLLATSLALALFGQRLLPFASAARDAVSRRWEAAV
ncbi:MAG: COX15/CtaA family protein [Planctomycetes bacterium]|nr:COX15/CtaA family protein [Planctomycetota bacterium]